tara:strand:+ start:229 stop:738 length:510 start_codon:yes stop_codon:yes gene_type:complete
MSEKLATALNTAAAVKPTLTKLQTTLSFWLEGDAHVPAFCAVAQLVFERDTGNTGCMWEHLEDKHGRDTRSLYREAARYREEADLLIVNKARERREHFGPEANLCSECGCDLDVLYNIECAKCMAACGYEVVKAEPDPDSRYEMADSAWDFEYQGQEGRYNDAGEWISA